MKVVENKIPRRVLDKARRQCTRSVNVEIHVWWSATVMVYVQRIDKVTLIDDIQ